MPPRARTVCWVFARRGWSRVLYDYPHPMTWPPIRSFQPDRQGGCWHSDDPTERGVWMWGSIQSGPHVHNRAAGDTMENTGRLEREA